jgi:hypothetical protein
LCSQTDPLPSISRLPIVPVSVCEVDHADEIGDQFGGPVRWLLNELPDERSDLASDAERPRAVEGARHDDRGPLGGRPPAGGEGAEQVRCELCDEPDAYLRPTLHWEHRDPVDTKRYLAVLKDLFDSGQMPEHGEWILQGEADEVPHEEIAAEIGVSTSVVRGRLFRMRARFRARLAMLGMLILLLLLFALLSPVSNVAAPAPAPVHSCSENRPLPSEEIAPWPLN